MRLPFFRNPSRIEELFKAIDRWQNTPFVDHGRVCGAGVDCIQFAACVLIELGQLDAFDPGPYTLDGGLHGKESLVVKWLDASPRFAKVDFRTHEPGDVLGFLSAKEGVVHHVGIALGGQSFVNAMPKYGVKVRTLRDPVWTRLLRVAYRPMEDVA